jgi:DNA primase
MDPRQFDIKAYLDDRGVKYTNEGPNIGSGDIGLDPCLWCGARNNHLGIKLTNKRVNCWVCGGHALSNFIMLIDGVSYHKVDSIMSEFVLEGGPFVAREKIYHTKLQYPKEVMNIDILGWHWKYLRDRNFNPETLQHKYKLKACGPHGNYKWRIIIPVIMNGQIGGFTSRDITDKHPLRYKNQPAGQSPIPQEQWIYNIDTVKDTAILVEGPTDVWRLREGAISLLGINPSLEQINKLSQIKNLLILFDMEDKAQQRAMELGENLAGITDHVEVITVDKKGDPASWTDEEAFQVRKELL